MKALRNASDATRELTFKTKDTRLNTCEKQFTPKSLSIHKLTSRRLANRKINAHHLRITRKPVVPAYEETCESLRQSRP